MIILESLSKKLTVGKVKVTRVTHWKGQTQSQVWLQPPPPFCPGQSLTADMQRQANSKIMIPELKYTHEVYNRRES